MDTKCIVTFIDTQNFEFINKEYDLKSSKIDLDYLLNNVSVEYFIPVEDIIISNIEFN